MSPEQHRELDSDRYAGPLYVWARVVTFSYMKRGPERLDGEPLALHVGVYARVLLTAGAFKRRGPLGR